MQQVNGPFLCFFVCFGKIEGRSLRKTEKLSGFVIPRVLEVID